jgi:hypothetical protein
MVSLALGYYVLQFGDFSPVFCYHLLLATNWQCFPVLAIWTIRCVGFEYLVLTCLTSFYVPIFFLWIELLGASYVATRS